MLFFLGLNPLVKSSLERPHVGSPWRGCTRHWDIGRVCGKYSDKSKKRTSSGGWSGWYYLTTMLTNLRGCRAPKNKVNEKRTEHLFVNTSDIKKIEASSLKTWH